MPLSGIWLERSRGYETRRCNFSFVGVETEMESCVSQEIMRSICSLTFFCSLPLKKKTSSLALPSETRYQLFWTKWYRQFPDTIFIFSSEKNTWQCETFLIPNKKRITPMMKQICFFFFFAITNTWQKKTYNDISKFARSNLHRL